ncbi:MAG: putative toxin-antitoxin system toxin component, PIN family [Nanoarchaeota archaeon]|nr:putative toxin-antitoxin system toxin component, PIN family [Nanoarchaeota archaeon]
MKVVLDTNVLLSAYLWRDSVSKKLVSELLHYKAEIYTSPDIMVEFQRVLKKDFAFMDNEVIDAMTTVLSFARIVHPSVTVAVVKDDPTDGRIIECAIASNSTYILSYNKHLLKLKEYEGIKMLRPEEMLAMLRMLY